LDSAWRLKACIFGADEAYAAETMENSLVQAGLDKGCGAKTGSCGALASELWRLAFVEEPGGMFRSAPF
jgi:hypothetical protein